MGKIPLLAAAMHGHLDVVKYLAERNDVDADSRDVTGETPLLVAAKNGHLETVKYLAEREDVEASRKDFKSRTSLSYAAEQGRFEVVKYLAERQDIKPDLKDSSGRTPLSLAAGEDGMKGDTVTYLSRRIDVDTNSKDKTSRTAPSWAARLRYNSENLRALLDLRDIDVNAKDDKGWTPLMHAVIEASSPGTELLVQDSRVYVNAEDNTGYTALMSVACLSPVYLPYNLQNWEVLAPRSNIDQDLKDRLHKALRYDQGDVRKSEVASIVRERNKRKQLVQPKRAAPNPAGRRKKMKTAKH